jgi:hypothetical protein
MSLADDPPDPEGPGAPGELPGGQVHSQLVEALILLLIEKGVMTRNDALSVVQTVAQVQRGGIVENGDFAAQAGPALEMLQRMYVSFEALSDRHGIALADGENVHRLRPPIYGDDRPEFPSED